MSNDNDEEYTINNEDNSIIEEDLSTSINRIETKSIHKICSGQVIYDLSSAVKELLENSLDAGAKIIEIKLKEFGFLSIEISDNGSGIDRKDFEFLAKKHYTSKMENFDDLSRLDTFGFRGEAINALCELSKSVSIQTKTENSDIAYALKFSRDGSLIDQVETIRAVGTTVIIENLFESLPVRRLDFEKSIKKQYQKLLKTIQAYAIISQGVRIVLTNSTAKTPKQIVLSTECAKLLPENISSIFGSKFFSSLVSVNIDFRENDSSAIVSFHVVEASSEVNIISATNNDEIENNDKEIPHPASRFIQSSTETYFLTQSSIVGYISKVCDGVGRSDNDRQFLFCNGRPVDLPKFSKVLNEVWRRYEMKNKPAFFLNILIPANSYDVNLSPDKREIAIVHEALLLEGLKNEIDNLYSSSRFTFPVASQKSNISQMLSGHSESLSTTTSQPVEENLNSQVSEATNVQSNNFNDDNESIQWISQADIEKSPIVNNIDRIHNYNGKRGISLSNTDQPLVSYIKRRSQERFVDSDYSELKHDRLSPKPFADEEEVELDFEASTNLAPGVFIPSYPDLKTNENYTLIMNEHDNVPDAPSEIEIASQESVNCNNLPVQLDIPLESRVLSKSVSIKNSFLLKVKNY